jgi:hypothetical protein
MARSHSHLHRAAGQIVRESTMSKKHRTDIIPAPFAAIVDAVCERDSQFFKDHPAESCYLRPYVPGEFPKTPSVPHHGLTQDDWVLVTYLGPGLRVRKPVMNLMGYPGSDGRMTLENASGIVARDVWVEGWPK